MFQNIWEENNEQENAVEETTIKRIMKKMFTKQNIVLYILSFLVSLVGFDQNIFPFGLAILVAACSVGMPVGVIFVLTSIGTFLSFGPASLVVYITTVLLFVVLILAFKPKTYPITEKNEKTKLGLYLFISCFVVQAVKIIFTNILIYNILESLMFCIVAFIFYKIFVNSIGVVTQIWDKKAFSIEEVVGATLLLTIAIASLGDLNIWGFSICNILCILLVLILGWKNGILVGGTAGITTGLVLGIIGMGEPMMIASFALSGMIAGVLNRFGKIGVIIGFILGNAILTYVSNGNLTAIIHLREILIAALGLLLVPKNIEINITDLIGKNKYLPITKDRALEANKDTIHKLNSVSEAISEIAKTYDEEIPEETREILEKENKELFIDELINNISNLTENFLYDDIVNEEQKIAEDIYEELVKKEELEIEDIVNIFEKHNNYIVGLEENEILKRDIYAMLKAINYTYKISKLNFVWKKKMVQSRRNVSQELNGVSKVISTLAEDINEKTEKTYTKQKQEIRILLEQKKIEMKDIEIKQEKNGKYIVTLYTTKPERNTTKIVENILTKVLKQDIQKHGRTTQTDEETYKTDYESEDQYSLQIGMAKAIKNNSPVSGDSTTKIHLKDGKYLLAISDGMGSGPNAQKSSKVAIKMLERLLKDGFDKDASLELINSTMVLNANEDMYATLDISILDLYTGNIECIKNGACPTYIKNKEKVEQIQAITLPAGILENIDLVVYDRDLNPEDIIIMCSDGILESKVDRIDKEQWLKNLLEQISTDNVQKIADILLGEAIDNGMGMAKDDMTVIVAKVSKK